MKLDSDSSTLSPLPDVLSHGLVAVSTFGLLSFFCSISLFFYLTWKLIIWHRYAVVKTPTNQLLLLIYNLLLADIQQACAFLLNITALRNNAIIVGTPVCFAQGWFVSTGDLASSVFICMIAVHTFFGVVRNYRPPTGAFYCCIFAGWAFVYTMAAIGPIIHGKDFYVRAAAWCWINDAFSSERLWLHYFWIFVAMFSTALIYASIYLWLRTKTQAGDIPSKTVHGATPLMILYPLIYTVCTAPLASLRIYALAGHDVSLGFFCMAGTMIACNGWLDVLLYASTRSDIVFAEGPPSEDTGLGTFVFMGNGRSMGNANAVGTPGYDRNGSRLGSLGRRSQDSDSLEHLYGLGRIGMKAEVTSTDLAFTWKNHDEMAWYVFWCDFAAYNPRLRSFRPITVIKGRNEAMHSSETDLNLHVALELGVQHFQVALEPAKQQLTITLVQCLRYEFSNLGISLLQVNQVIEQHKLICRKMPFPKKLIPVLSFLIVFIIVWIITSSIPTAPKVAPNTQKPDRKDHKGEYANSIHNEQAYRKPEQNKEPETSKSQEQDPLNIEAPQEEAKNKWPAAIIPFRPGVVKAVGEPYTKTIVVPRTKNEEVDWIFENFGGDKFINHTIYTVDDPAAELHPPKNKGHEVMVYLSYIIDHYDNLSDVNIFMHAHRYAWHNDDLLDGDAVQMISRLSAERATREGYMNMRCHWDPGCPAWMHPGTVEEDVNKQEETMLAKSWSELFPLDPIPKVLAQPCCAQFAISKERIRSLPLARYVFYRDWLFRTSLSDYISGRVWEYIWQFIFTGDNVVCPKEHVCYCDGFGVCFGGEDEYIAYYIRHKEREKLEDELREWHISKEKFDSNPEEFGDELEPPEVGRDLELEGRIKGLLAWCEQQRQLAKEHGDVAMNRAKEAGRDWKDGDGF
ncbi:hypothetical protein G7Y89_g5780 [Cudoniella acicularis]|uniref:Glucose receptor Git3 N-terminal domain-containing protein n=1 Tax=Cudoniella acicularis TaxID=354080 RepID=A0A8H4RP57_9HELO|nr:hypothetical protein G7Y89_g5780 [Cudoniella acicularis]